jgi:UDP-3-O-[3-hydroxymyristoyl] glucosamine N-acyltransferase
MPGPAQPGAGAEGVNPSITLFESAFDAYGVPKDRRGPDHFFLETRESDQRPFAVPNEFYGPPLPGTRHPEVMRLHPNGFAVALQSSVDPGVTGGPRTMIHSGANLHSGVSLGAQCEVRPGAVVYGRTTLEDSVRLGAHSVVRGDSTIGKDSILGPHVTLDASAQVGKGVVIEEHVTIGAESVIGDRNRLGARSLIGDNVKTGDDVTLMGNNSVGSEASIGSGSYLLPGVRVRRAKSVKPNTVVVPSSYRRWTLRASQRP